MTPPEPPESGPTTAELRYQFWMIVGVINVAVLATAVGVLVLAFRSRPTLGVGLLAVGVGAGVFAVLRYRRVQASLSESEPGGGKA